MEPEVTLHIPVTGKLLGSSAGDCRGHVLKKVKLAYSAHEHIRDKNIRRDIRGSKKERMAAAASCKHLERNPVQKAEHRRMTQNNRAISLSFILQNQLV